jgi:tRNA modification GTPase
MDARPPGGDTIVALATPPGPGAVALLRLSGPGAKAIAEKIFSGRLAPRRAVHGNFTEAGGLIIDDGLAVWFPAPHSYTGEETVELTPHGSPLIVQRLLAAALAQGACAARAGEFTYRAFVGGKLDLAQAESVDALIRAETEAERVAARRGVAGELGKKLAPLEQRLRELISRLEGAVEFVEERIDFNEGSGSPAQQLQSLHDDLAALQAEMARGAKLREDIAVAIVGPPNAGKSTLFNFLAGGEPAIVSSIPGTTRDLLRERIEVRGLKVRLTDTAGMREAGDEIEAIGVERAKVAGKSATLRLLVLDGRWSEENRGQLEFWAVEDTLVVLNKADLYPAAPELIAALQSAGRPFLATAMNDSARQPLLKTSIEEFIAPAESLGEAIAATPRALSLLADALGVLAQARKAQAEKLSEEFVLEHLWAGLRALGELTRPTDREEIYGLIFSNFCIGK